VPEFYSTSHFKKVYTTTFSIPEFKLEEGGKTLPQKKGSLCEIQEASTKKQR
jgi:ssDNA-specific exonuclease RecJ